jgi:hypothetical protein
MRWETVNIGRSVPKYALVVKVGKIVATDVTPGVLLGIEFDKELNFSW